jgi:hypothetical protein
MKITPTPPSPVEGEGERTGDDCPDLDVSPPLWRGRVRVGGEGGGAYFEEFCNYLYKSIKGFLIREFVWLSLV